MQTSESAGLVQGTYNQRSRFDLDTDRDPLFTDADKVIKNPEGILKVKAQTQILGVGKTRYNCIKGYDLLERKCRWTRVAKKTGTRQEYKTHFINLSNQALYTDYCRRTLANGGQPVIEGLYTNPGEYVPGRKETYMDTHINYFKRVFGGKDVISGKTVNIDRSKIVWVINTRSHGPTQWMQALWDSGYHYPAYQEFKVTIGVDVPIYDFEWRNNCQDLEGQVDTGACEYSSKRCVEGAETRMVEGTPVYSKCWAEEAVYQCRTQEEDHCNQWAKKGCLQIGSRCLTYLEQGHCVKWQQTYECTSNKRQSNITTLSGQKPFCLDGTCVDQTWDGNGDMVDALAKLAIFKEMQKGLDANMGIVFKGRNLGCSRVPTGFKDCCKIKGWGKDIHLASCSSEEEDLGEQRKLNKCLMIGTYCTDKVLGVCTRKKTTYCCYPSKLSKIINVQGKRQLGLSFGNAENPECGGLTLDQISRVDFSKLDLSELFSEMFANLKTPNTTNLGKDIQKSMTNKTYMVNDNKKKITQGKAHGTF